MRQDLGHVRPTARLDLQQHALVTIEPGQLRQAIPRHVFHRDRCLTRRGQDGLELRVRFGAARDEQAVSGTTGG
jgi:hypothetical protein